MSMPDFREAWPSGVKGRRFKWMKRHTTKERKIHCFRHCISSNPTQHHHWRTICWKNICSVSQRYLFRAVGIWTEGGDSAADRVRPGFQASSRHHPLTNQRNNHLTVMIESWGGEPLYRSDVTWRGQSCPTCLTSILQFHLPTLALNNVYILKQ